MNNSEADPDNPQAQHNSFTASFHGSLFRAMNRRSLFAGPISGVPPKTVATLLGEIVWLFTQSSRHQGFLLVDLEWLVMAPLMYEQLRVFYAPDRPVGVALWAYVNEAVATRLMTGNAQLAPADWQSGNELWLVEMIAPFGGQIEMILNLKEAVFPQTPLKILTSRDGTPSVQVL